jgi:thimet oligopeptidase
MGRRFFSSPIGIVFLVVVGCQKMGCGKKTESNAYRLWNPEWSHTVQEIDATCQTEQEALKAKLNAIGKLGPEATFQTACLGLERSLGDFQQTLAPLTFLKYVSDNAEVREAAGKCESAVDQFRVEIFAREDLFASLKAAEAKKESLSAEDSKLMEEFLLAFKRNGLELPATERSKFIEKRKRIVALEADFGKELIEWNTWVELTKEQLAGLPDSFINRLEKTQAGKYKVTVKYPDYYPFMENASNIEARKMLEEKFYMRGGEANRKRLDEALRLRDETAKMLGYANHAAYVLDDRMAKTPEAVAAFLGRVGERIKAKAASDLKELLAAKNADLGKKSDGVFHSHDWRYYDNQIKKTKHQIDMQVIKEYFPLEVVNKGMFEIYQTLLGVQFVEDPSLQVWHSSVKAYRVNRDGKTVAIFFMDLFPRKGKYGHAAAFTLIQGCKNEDGTYQLPISSIVANFNPPAEGKPSLLEHGEVETLFHEFGHIMHQVLTTASYASFSGTSVKRDFVEAPSQMLENWVWDKAALAKLSGHYQDTSKPLPDEQIQKLMNAKLLNVGVKYSRQLLFATLDQQYHTDPNADTTEVYAKLAKEIMHIPIPEGTLPQAGFGHFMGGYDSGYYGYLWSEVYAQDMFTRFEKEGLLNPKTGADYRTWILEKGGALEPMALIKGFLGREPNEEAFYRSLGLNSDSPIAHQK